MPLIEVTYGAGLGGASVTYGFPACSDEEYLRAVVPQLKNARVSALLLPGIGTVDHLRMVRDIGVGTIRVATQCTEADVAEQHIGLGRKLGMDTVGFLMMAHMLEPRALLAQAKLMESYGANCIYCTDSAGYMLPDDVRARIDGSAAGLGAGAGNTPLEIFAAVLDRMGIETGIDVFKLIDVAEGIVVPMMDQPIRVDRDSLILGYAGVYSSFLLHAKRASEKYGVPSTEILVELGRLKTVGGQENMMEHVALNIASARSSGRPH